MNRHSLQWIWIAALLGNHSIAWSADTSPSQELKRWVEQSKQTASSTRGAHFFNSKHGGDWSCSSCHGTPPTQTGKHASTGKPIAPLAPAYNSKAFTDSAKADKWFKRNCKDVLSRECTPSEKADVLAYLIDLK